MGPADSWPFFFKCKGWEDQEELGSSRRAAKPRAGKPRAGKPRTGKPRNLGSQLNLVASPPTPRTSR